MTFKCLSTLAIRWVCTLTLVVITIIVKNKQRILALLLIIEAKYVAGTYFVMHDTDWYMN